MKPAIRNLDAKSEGTVATVGPAGAKAAGRVRAIDRRRTDRLAMVARLAAGVAHELGTPLSVVSARAQLLLSTEMSRPDVAANAGIIIEQADRMAVIIQQLLDFSRRRSLTLSLASLQHVVVRTLDLLAPVAERSGVALHCAAVDTPLLANIDQAQLQQALANVTLNAIQSMPNGGEVHVDIDTQRTHPPMSPRASDRAFVRISVDDEGGGIPPEHVAHVFEPFFTTRTVGEGTGLGLAVAYGIVSEHGGWIGVESTVGKGSRFVIFLPQAEWNGQDGPVAS
jgi:signal transduction histidine kinase